MYDYRCSQWSRKTFFFEGVIIVVSQVRRKRVLGKNYSMYKGPGATGQYDQETSMADTDKVRGSAVE